jgi:CIC family chloride channel protein
MQSYPVLKNLYLWFKSKHFGQNSTDTHYALLEACLIGVLSGISAVLLKEGVGWLGAWRIQLSHQFGALWVLPLGGLLLGWLAGTLMEQLAPGAAGGGIPQVKAALARFPVPLSLRVAVVKMLGTILVLGGGLTLGRRAPTVHIGAALAAQLSRWIPTSPEHRRQMIAAGAASGLAAGFTTPIAGVLFVVEELMRDASGLTLETAIMASFTGAVVSLVLQSGNLNIPGPLLQDLTISFSTPEIPVYILLGTLTGVLGALFNQGILLSFKIQHRFNLSLSWRIGLVGLISGIIIAILPPFFRDNAALRDFLVSGELTWQTITIAFIAHFFLTMLAYSSGAPGGLFAPALVLGSALGYLVGEVTDIISGIGAEATYALAGMGGFFTAVVRAPVTAIIIVFELRANFNLVLPLMITSAVSYLVAENVFKRSLYEHLLDASGIHITEEMPSNDFLTQLKAADVMQSQVETLESNLTLEEVLQAMSRSPHRGFPVVETGKLVGIITQSDIAKITQRSHTKLRQFMTPNPIIVQPDTSLSDVLYLLNRYQLSRLPVTNEQKLVGIITRTDIIRAEVNQISGGSANRQPIPAYVIYQTRSPALGKGRILFFIDQPQIAPILLKIAIAIARHQDYELECLQILKVPKHSPPAETKIKSHDSRKLMQKMERLARHWDFPIHTQIRVAQDTAEAILDVIQERNIDLLLMDWQGKSEVQGTIFGLVEETLIHKASCDLMLIKLGNSLNAYPYQLDHTGIWLVPMAGGPNAQRAINLLPGLTQLYSEPNSPEMWLCKVYPPSETEPDSQSLNEAATNLQNQLDQPVIPIPVRSHSVTDAIIQLATRENCDLIILGASKEGLLQQAIHGNIPSAIANGVDSTVILVRGKD